MTLKEINSLEKTLKLPHNKLKDFFKNQKTKARKNCSPLKSKKKSYDAFEYKDRLILEEYFKKNPKLDTDTLLKL